MGPRRAAAAKPASARGAHLKDHVDDADQVGVRRVEHEAGGDETGAHVEPAGGGEGCRRARRVGGCDVHDEAAGGVGCEAAHHRADCGVRGVAGVGSEEGGVSTARVNRILIEFGPGGEARGGGNQREFEEFGVGGEARCALDAQLSDGHVADDKASVRCADSGRESEAETVFGSQNFI